MFDVGTLLLARTGVCSRQAADGADGVQELIVPRMLMVQGLMVLMVLMVLKVPKVQMEPKG
jgi:hypothetical protein